MDCLVYEQVSTLSSTLFPRCTFETLSRQAAEVDLSSVRETAVMGLQRLEAVDQDFSPFQVC